MTNDNDENQDLLLDHDYDGIQELDNNLPNWWLWTFLLSIVFAFLYWIHYDISQSGPTMDQELSMGMAVIEENRKVSSQENGGAGATSKEDLLVLGGKVFKNYCAACHGEKGEGTIGPNLTDNYWIHGKGDDSSLKKVIADGVLDKGMPSWKALLKPADMKSVVYFIKSLHGSNPPNAKAPQGELIEI